MRHLVFVSHRTGRPELFLELRDSGQLLQLTEHEGLAEFSITPSHDGRYVYFADGQGAWRVDTETCQEEQLASFATVAMRERRHGRSGDGDDGAQLRRCVVGGAGENGCCGALGGDRYP